MEVRLETADPREHRAPGKHTLMINGLESQAKHRKRRMKSTRTQPFAKQDIASDNLGFSRQIRRNFLQAVRTKELIVGLKNQDIISACHRDALVQRVRNSVIRLADPANGRTQPLQIRVRPIARSSVYDDMLKVAHALSADALNGPPQS